jgi:serine protease
MPIGRTRPASASGGGSVIPGPLSNFGGPVQTAPTIYVVYWGWTSDPYGVQPYLNAFLANVGGTPWLNTVTEYSGAGNPANLLAGTWSDFSTPPAQPSDADIQAEANAAVLHFGLGTSLNIQIVVALPTGHAPVGFATTFCAYHGVISARPNVTYTALPYMPDAGATCGFGLVNASALDGVSIVEGHEIAESITDPLLNSWFDFGFSPSNEVADKCAWTSLVNISTSGGTFPVQPLWSNAANGCVLPAPIAPSAPSSLGDATGGIACPTAVLLWPSVPGATSYQVWERELSPTIGIFSNIWSGTATRLRVSMPRNWSFNYAVTACNANGWCSGFSPLNSVRGGTCQ